MFNMHRLLSKSDAISAECEASAPARETKVDSTDVAAMNREAARLNAIGECMSKQAVPTAEAYHDAGFWYFLAAPAIALAGVLPWAWYFLLRRVAELRASVAGKPPE